MSANWRVYGPPHTPGPEIYSINNGPWVFFEDPLAYYPGFNVTVGCYPNCDASTTPPALNVGDFTCFLQKFAAADAYANCDQSTTAPVLNVGDFTCFLQKFAAGCP
jgi:hypothetical protein